MAQLVDLGSKYVKRHDDAKNKAWQFQYELTPFEESKNFADSKHGSKEASFAAARAHRDEFLTALLDLGLVDSAGIPIRERLPVTLKLSPKNTSGIIGVFRESVIRKNSPNRQESWVANFKDETGRDKQKRFFVKTLGERTALLSALRFRQDFVSKAASSLQEPDKRELLENHVKDLELLAEFIETLIDEVELFFFLSTLNNPLVSATEKQDMLAIRIGQARFRNLVLAVWEGKCAVTSSTQLLVAGHIKPWSSSNNQERLDPYNGIALSPVYDKAFDSGLISFDEEGRLLLSNAFKRNSSLLMVTGQERVQQFKPQHLAYLEYHRRHRFKNDA